MTWHKYFAIGGREVGNAARAIGIQDSADCSVHWIVDRDKCETLADALGDEIYSAFNPDAAPWYDPDMPDRSARILGLYPIEIAGLEDDMRGATVEERVVDGGHIGRLRRSSRAVTVRALLMAEGRDALEAGMTWLRGTLDARECGMHNSGCGLTDFEYFVDCPPARETGEEVGVGGYGEGPYGEGPYGTGPAPSYGVGVPQTDEEYAATVDTYRRYLHSVKVVGGPRVTRKLESQDHRYHGNLVEFTLVSELPGIFTKTRQLELSPTIPSFIADMPFNLVLQPRPVNTTTPSVVAIKQLQPNPSLETDATGYTVQATAISGDDPSPYFTHGRVVGELGAVGSASYRARILGDGATAASGRARIVILAPDSALDDVSERVSFSVWAAMASVGGATGAVPVSVTAKVDWRSASALLRTDTIGTGTTAAELSGKAWSIGALKPPAGATIARVYVEFVIDWSSSSSAGSNSDIRAYVDAVAVTVP